MLNELITEARKIQKEHWKKIDKLEEKKKAIELKINNEWRKDFGDIKLIYKPLAEAICKKMGIKYYTIYGPFGLDNETSIFFSNVSQKPSKSEKLGLCRPINICNVDTYGLYDLVTRGENEMEIHYATGEGVRKPLPDNLDDIIKVLRFSPAKEEKIMKVIWVLQGNYGYGWDDLTYENTKEEALKQKKCYDENESYLHRIIKRHVNE